MDIKLDLDKAMQQLTDLATTYVPKAIDLAASVVQINAFHDLLIAVLLVSIVVLYHLLAAPPMIKRDEATRKAQHYYDDGWMFVAIIGYIITAIISFIGVLQLLDVWMWVGIFEPKLRLAHDVWNMFLTK